MPCYYRFEGKSSCHQYLVGRPLTLVNETPSHRPRIVNVSELAERWDKSLGVRSSRNTRSPSNIKLVKPALMVSVVVTRDYFTQPP